MVIAHKRYDPAKPPDSVWPYGIITALIALFGYVITNDLTKATVMVPAVFLLTSAGVHLMYYTRRRMGR